MHRLFCVDNLIKVLIGSTSLYIDFIRILGADFS